MIGPYATTSERRRKSGTGEALDVIARDGEPHIIFLDVNMPVMDGPVCLAHLRESGTAGRVSVVMVSTEGRPDDKQRALAGGAVDYVQKPFRGGELVAVLQRYLAGKPGAAVAGDPSRE